MALKLASITGWQEERRRALALLTHKADLAWNRCQWELADALHAARRDVESTLRQMAADAIAEGMHMRWAHEEPLLRRAA